jgi:hypothetical protein
MWIPFGHSPDCDLITEIGGRLVRVQVKTVDVAGERPLPCCIADQRRQPELDRGREALLSRPLRLALRPRRRWAALVHPATEVGGATGIVLGGPKYAAYEVEPGRPLVAAIAV